MDLRLTTDSVGGVPVLGVSGELDLATLPQFRNALVRLVSDASGARVAVDLDGVVALDDTGLGILLGAAGRARESGGDLVVVCSDERLRARLALLRFDRAVTVVDAAHDVTPHDVTPHDVTPHDVASTDT